MADFSPSDAAFEGFRITREHPSAIPLWAILQFLVSMGVMWAMVSSGYLDAVMSMQATGGAPNLEVLGPASVAFVQRFVPLLPVLIVVSAMMQTAVMRMVLRPDQRSPGYLRLSMDELRVVGTQVVVGVVIGGFVFLGMVIISAIIGVGGVFGALLSFPLMLAYLAGIVFLSVKLSLAVAVTFARGKMDLKTAWEMTRGKFWPMLGAYGLAIVLYLVVLIAGSLIGGAVGSVLGGANPPEGAKTFQEFLTAGQLASDVVGAIIAALGSAILFAPTAVIYRALSNERAAEAF